jgi:hypothetical protein
MRLWTVHPRYLDPRGLVAVWREALLAQAVLAGRTEGYRHHPQLDRFRAHPEPLSMIAAYLRPLRAEAAARGYRFDSTKILGAPECGRVEETEGQLLFEWRHLLGKLEARSPALYRRCSDVRVPEPHPLFEIVPGGRRPWERAWPVAASS